MTVKQWIIECDFCGRVIDATQESFVERDENQLCYDCARGDKPKPNEYTVRWSGLVRGIQKVRAININEARQKAEDGMEITVVNEEPEWNIDVIVKEN